MIDICQELHQNFLDYSYETNSERAFADARDGLKPGQRACLWEMYHKGFFSNKPHVKSAKISGGVCASWHPHGTTAVYETFARMSLPFVNNNPEVDWHGANGSIVMGFAPAAERYTEARLSKLTEDGMFCGLKKENVPMKMNFSEDEEMPVVLPALFPRLMVNGCQGIGVSIANVWLCHNLGEVCALITKYAETGEIDYSNIAPDFPTGGIIINKNDLSSIYTTGRGKVILRGKVDVQKNSILITELPYQVYVEPFIDNIKELVTKETLSGIKNIYNKTDKTKMLIEIECSEDPNKILQKLYQLTNLQKDYNANQYALVGKTPKLLTLKEYFDIYINHNMECINKEHIFDLTKAEKRLEIVNGLLIAFEDIDNIITLIKKSENAKAAVENLIVTYKLNERQAKAIVDMKLGRLARLEKIELETEAKELKDSIKFLGAIVNNPIELKRILLKRLSEFSNKYTTKRKTEITQIAIAKTKEEKEIAAVTPEEVVVVVTEKGFAKRIPKASFRTQKRGGKGVKVQEDSAKWVFKTNTIDNLMVFTSKGKVYNILVNDLPVGTNVTKGSSLSTLITLATDEEIMAVSSLYRNSEAKYVVFVTKQGIVKKVNLDEFASKRKNGIIAITLKEGDTLTKVTFANEEDLIIITNKAQSLRFSLKDLGASSRIAKGVKGINLGNDDYVIDALPIKHDSDYLATFTANGMCKKTPLKEFPIQSKGGKGLISHKNANLVGTLLVDDDDEILIIGSHKSLCILAKDIPPAGRNTQGVNAIEGDIVSVSKI